MRRYIYLSLPFLFFATLAAVDPVASGAEYSGEDSVAEILTGLGAEVPEHRPHNIDGVSVEAGRNLVLYGITSNLDGPGRVRRQSKHFVCTSCHNIEKEDSDLRSASPEARLAYAVENDLPFLPGTTLYGVVNRTSFYNDDYEKKYGDLVRPARKNLREAIALCATECAQGRELEDWEMESVLAYLWTIDLKMKDLNTMSAAEVALVDMALDGRENKSKAIEAIQRHFLDYSPAHFVTPPEDRVAGYPEVVGDAANGAILYERSCLHCHGERRYSFFNLDETAYSYDFLTKHFPQYTRYSTYQVVRYGTSPIPGKRAYMPHYTQERMSNQQVEDLRAFLAQGDIK